MARKSTRNNKFLFNSKDITSPKVYAFLVKLVNEDREDLAEKALRADYLLNYAQSCIKQKDKAEAKTALEKVKDRLDEIKAEGFDPEQLQYLYEGTLNKVL